MKNYKVQLAVGLLAACMTGIAAPPLLPEVPGIVASAAEQEITADLTLDSDMTVDGDLVLSAGTLNLNGFTLTVKGNLIHQGGTLTVGGSLRITGSSCSYAAAGKAGTADLRL
ncbi:MAG: hypothetical protein J6S92_13915, partial [Oscillospiraceae bacterium]|nr:hypothetical protein [Oscillospiraceae bacterium]